MHLSISHTPKDVQLHIPKDVGVLHEDVHVHKLHTNCITEKMFGAKWHEVAGEHAAIRMERVTDCCLTLAQQ